MNLGICGISGRMGNAIFKVANDRGHQLVAAFDSNSSPLYGKEVTTILANSNSSAVVNEINSSDIKKTDGIIDFSSVEATLALLNSLKENNRPLVIGTTGFSDEEKKKIEEASKIMPIVFSPNMSVGVNLLFKLTAIASSVLNEDFDVELFEAHHRFKKDAPSGTAKKLLEVIKENSNHLTTAEEKNGRSGFTGERTDDEIGVMVMRGGDTVGDHTVFFSGMGERIELTHRATSRETFARGAVLALEFLQDKKTGLYSMFDVLGL